MALASRSALPLALTIWQVHPFRLGSRVHTYTEGAPGPLSPLLVREGVVNLVRRGIPFRMLDEVAAAAGVGRLAMAAVIGLSPTTLARRRRSGTLAPGESDRLVRVARLVGMTYELMRGDAEAARDWLRRGHELIEGESPLERASTEVGGREVEQLIGRLRHGIFS